MRTQVEVEQLMVNTGAARTRTAFQAAEESGNADRNPYAATLYRDFVQPLAVLIEEAQQAKGAAMRQAHVVLLRGLDPWSIAYIAVRVVITSLMAPRQGADKSAYTEVSTWDMSARIGRSIHAELYLTQFAELAPDLYYIMDEHLFHRASKSTEHRIAAFRKAAATHGLALSDWGIGARQQVGMWLISKMIEVGLLIMGTIPPNQGKRPAIPLWMPDDVMDTIESIKETCELSAPYTTPCVERPKPWTAWNDGGWHTPEMRRNLPYCVKASGAARAQLANIHMPVVLECINALQDTAWSINNRILATARALAPVQNFGEIAAAERKTKPEQPAWLADIGDNERSPEQEAEFVEWKRRMAEWYTEGKLQRSARVRLGTILRVAEEFKDYPELFFVYHCDSRGRVYPSTTGVSPQGSDLQKAMLEFAHGKQVKGKVATEWFLINGANKFGFDKAPLAERATWHMDKAPLLLSFADDPVNNQGWQEADKPFQFLAWCFEYAEWFRTGSVCSHLPVGLDGSCSGLQHLSAMLRDEIGGKAVNLTPSTEMQDIYKYVADAATARMQADAPDDEDKARYRSIWLAHGINRKVTKRMTMTTPYGVTQRSAVKYVIEDYLKAMPEFDKADHYGLASYLVSHAWPAIGDVVIKGRKAMAWLTGAAKAIVKAGADTESAITWRTPSGFLASQMYREFEEHRVATKLLGHARIKAVTATGEVDSSRHATGMAPNFVHSMDAAHLHLVAAAMEKAVPGAPLAFIHDDMGTHAADTQVLYNVIREQFVAMYSNHKPLEELHAAYPMTTPPPEEGTLDLSGILASEFAFS